MEYRKLSIGSSLSRDIPTVILFYIHKSGSSKFFRNNRRWGESSNLSGILFPSAFRIASNVHCLVLPFLTLDF